MRLARGGSRIDRAAPPVRFTFDGRELQGLRGDTLASALLANGVRGAWRSLYHGRPRGIMGLGPEDPCALVQVTRDGISEPMLRATDVELVDGLVAEPLAGRGRLVRDAVAPHHDKRHVHCDALVVGGGPAGCAAATAAAAGGARVILAETAPVLATDVAAAEELQVLTRTTAVGAYDDGYVVLAQRSRLWHVRAQRVILAAGAVERTIAFAGNDRPGVMLAGAARAYVQRYAVAPGSVAAVFTTDDSGHEAAAALAEAGVAVAAVADARDGAVVCGTEGGDALRAVRIREPDGAVRHVPCDLLAVAGGWNPSLELWTQAQGTLRWDDAAAAFVPGAAPARWAVVGAAGGTRDVAAAIAEGTAAGTDAADAAGFPVARNGHVPRRPAVTGRPPLALFAVPPQDGEGWAEHYLDLQRDATVADLHTAVGAGLRSPEHVKRFTTIGTANDQGRTSGVLTLGVLAGLLGAEPAALHPTTHRPPAVPVSFSLLAGRDRGVLSDPVRTTAIHPWHVAHGAVLEDVGQWKRPWFYPREGEDIDAAVLRECRAAREGVAVMDASTLGKIDVQGPDAVTFLNRLYTGDFGKLGVGRCKYGILCTADGMLFDDGVSMRLAEDRFLVTTTTGNAAAVLDWFEEWLQTEWPELRVHCTSVTEQWATVAVVGPRSREVVGALAPELDVANEAFRFMDIREAEVTGVHARVCRVSFSGELAYEINVPTWHGLAVWEAVMAAGEPFGITPYGTETMHVLRAEKGYVIVGQETDGTVTPQDLGLDWMIAKGKGDFVGRRSHRRTDAMRADRKQLVALLPSERVPEGAQLVLEEGGPMVGHVTSSYDSAALGRPFCLALLAGGRERHGETVLLPLLGRTVGATVADPVLYDPDGSRRDGAGLDAPIIVDDSASWAPSPRPGGLVTASLRRRGTAGIGAPGPSPLAHRAEELAAAPVGLRELPLLAQVAVRLHDAPGAPPRRAGSPAGAAVVASALGFPLPGVPNTTTGDATRRALWLGPDEWLVVGPAGDAEALEALLAGALSRDLGSVVGLSANRTVLELRGPHARDVLAAGCSLDLHSRAFAPGRCAQTLLARAPVILEQTGDEPVYRLFVRGSLAGYLADWLLDAAAGVTGSRAAPASGGASAPSARPR